MKLRYLAFLCSAVAVAYPYQYSHETALPVVDVVQVEVRQAIDLGAINQELQDAADRAYYLEQELNYVIDQYNQVVYDYNSLAHYPEEYAHFSICL